MAALDVLRNQAIILYCSKCKQALAQCTDCVKKARKCFWWFSLRKNVRSYDAELPSRNPEQAGDLKVVGPAHARPNKFRNHRFLILLMNLPGGS